MGQLNPTFRMYAESSGRTETQMVVNALRELESQGLTGADRNTALDGIRWGIERHRAQELTYYEKRLARERERWERKADRNAPAESVKFQRLQARIAGMTPEEAKQRAEELRRSEGALNGDEVDLISQRLQSMGESSEVEALRDTARERHAWEPWSQEGEGKEYQDAVDDLMSRPFGHVGIESDGETLEIPVESLADFDGELDRQEA